MDDKILRWWRFLVKVERVTVDQVPEPYKVALIEQ